MTRLSAQDFLKKFIFDVTCLINENKGVVDRLYNTNVIVAAFGVKPTGIDDHANEFIDASCQVAIKVTDLGARIPV